MRTSDARQDWEARIGRRSDTDTGAGAGLAPPGKVHVTGGVAQITVDWDEVDGALGYVVYRADGRRGPYAIVDFGGGDVLAVPSPPFADTTIAPGRTYWYRVGAITDPNRDDVALSDAAAGRARRAADALPVVRVRADASAPPAALRRPWRMLGSERLSQLLDRSRSGGRVIRDDFAAALARARVELGATMVRAHAILHDDLGVLGPDGALDFTRVDAVYDEVLALGYHPIVELSFMPAALAADRGATVFDYRAIVSPPADWDAWARLVAAFTRHCVERYGLDEVRGWGFEVWNEPNLAVFWTGTQRDYFRLYDVTARAVRSVDDRLLVGGPGTAQCGWILDFLDHVLANDVPLDFVSTHVYGTYPLNVRALLDARGLPDVAVWWTEWGVTPRHFAPINDAVFAAPFVLHGMKAAQRHADALAYWVVSDHFEELGRPPALLHGGFGLLTVGNLAKTRYHALALAERLGDDQLPITLDGDGARSLVDAWVTRAADGTLDVLVWNGTLDQSKVDGDPALARRVAVALDGVDDGIYRRSDMRIDVTNGDIAATPLAAPWPADGEWDRLREHDRLVEVDGGTLVVAGGRIDVELVVAMPGVARVRLRPQVGADDAWLTGP